MIRISFRMALVFFLQVSAAGSEARTLVVSDIDDTLKISHVRDSLDAVDAVLRTDVAFAGMAELFQALAKNPSVEFIYLSNAPSWLMDANHREFLRRGGFPDGEVMLRGFGDSEHTFKPMVLQSLSQRPHVDQIFLFGDNGERDPAIFMEFFEQRSKPFAQAWVHAIYPNNLELVSFNDLLKPYGSAYDLALQLEDAELIDEKDVTLMRQVVYDKLILDLRDESGSVQVFPPWTDCHPALYFDHHRLSPEWIELLSVGCALGR